MKCPQCGAENQLKNKFCPECGCRLTASAAEPRIELVKKEIPATLVQKIRLTKDAASQERKNVTVVFTDISGFTSLSEKLDPEELTLLMNDCFKKLSTCIYRYEGIIDKFIGDCIMAIFGAPITHEDDPERAVLACLDMQTALDEINGRLDPAIKKLAIHSGINSGEVIAGKIGSDLQMEYTVMGDTVNVAQRLKDIAAPGTILVGPETYDRTRYAFQYQIREPVALKGKAETVRTYQVIGRAWGTEFGPTAFHSDLIGRKEELELLKNASRRLRQGKSSIILLKGEIGVGKSRLLYEFKKHLSVSAEPLTIIDDRGLSYESSIPFKSFADSIFRYLTLGTEKLPDDPGPVIRSRVKELLADAEGDAGPYLYRVLGLKLTEAEMDKIRFLDSHSLQLQIFLAASQLFEKIAAIQPLVIIIDDIQWFDSASLELISFLLAGVKNNNVAFYFSYRVSDMAPIKPFLAALEKDYPDCRTEIVLGNLDAEDSRRLIDHLTADRLPESVCRYIIEKSSGNPFFIEEIARNIMESGRLEKPEALAADEIAIPGSIESAITARIDGLPREAKYLLKIASIIGRSFPRALLEEVVKEKEILDHTEELEKKEFLVRMIKDQHVHYAFRHPLFHEVSYHSILKSERTVYHRLIAETLEKRVQKEIEGYYAILGHHYLQAQDPVRALPYLKQAGDEAAGLYANDEALRLYGLALDIAAEDQERTELLIKMAGILLLTGRLQEAKKHLESALALNPNPAQQALINTRRAKILEITGHTDETIALFEQILNSAPERTSPFLITVYYDFASVVLEARSDYARSRQLVDAGLALAGQIKDQRLIAEGLRTMGQLLYRQGAGREALEYLIRAGEYFNQLKDQAGLAGLHLLTASVYRMQGDLKHAIASAQQAIEGFERIGNRRLAAIGHNNLGTYYDLTGDQDQALIHYEKSLAVRQLLGDRKGEAIAYSNLALIKEQQGETETALKYFLQALTIMEEINDVRGIINTELSLFKIHLSRMELDEAKRLMDRLQAQSRSLQDKLQLSDIMHDQGYYYLVTGDLDRAREILDQALELVDQETDRHRRVNILNTRIEVALQQSDSRALIMAQEAFTASKQSQMKKQEIISRRLLGTAQIRYGDREEGLRQLREGLRLSEQYRLPVETAYLLAELGQALGNEEGRDLLARSRDLFRRSGIELEARRVDAWLRGHD